MRSKPSWSNHVPKAPPLNTSTLGDISDPNLNKKCLRMLALWGRVFIGSYFFNYSFGNYSSSRSKVMYLGSSNTVYHHINPEMIGLLFSIPWDRASPIQTAFEALCLTVPILTWLLGSYTIFSQSFMAWLESLLSLINQNAGIIELCEWRKARTILLKNKM